MSQTTFDDEDLFGEAAAEVREDVERALGEARSSLPDPDDVWDADADNVLGVLNGLRSAMDPGDAEAHLRDAKKWFTMGERADAFDDAEDLAAEIEAIEDVIADMATAREQVSDVAGTIPALRSALEEAQAASGEQAPDDAAADESEFGDESASADDDATEEEEEAATDGGEADADGAGEADDSSEAAQATLDGDD